MLVINATVSSVGFFFVAVFLFLLAQPLQASNLSAKAVFSNPYVSEEKMETRSISLEKISKAVQQKNGSVTFDVFLNVKGNGIGAEEKYSENRQDEEQFIFALQKEDKEIPLTILSQVILNKKANAQNERIQQNNLKKNLLQNIRSTKFKVQTAKPLGRGNYHLQVKFFNIQNVAVLGSGKKNPIENSTDESSGSARFFETNLYKNALSIKRNEKKVSLIFLIDNSASMQRNDFENARFSRIVAVLQSEHLRNSVKDVGVYSFAKDVKTVLPLTSVRALNMQKMHNAFEIMAENASKGLETSFVNAFSFLQELIAKEKEKEKERKKRSYQKYRIVFITDGVPSKPYAGLHQKLDSDVAMYTVGISRQIKPGSKEKLEYNEKLLRNIAEETGGKFFAARSDIMETLYRDVLPENKISIFNQFVSVVKPRFSSQEMVRLKITPAEMQPFFNFEISSRQKNTWLRNKKIVAAFNDIKNDETMFLPLRVGSYRIKAINSKTGFTSHAFFKVYDIPKPFSIVGLAPTVAKNPLLHFADLQSDKVQTRYAKIHYTAENDPKNNSEMERIEDNFSKHFFLIRRDNRFEFSRTIVARQTARRIQFLLQPAAAHELSREQNIFTAINAVGLVSALEDGGVSYSNPKKPFITANNFEASNNLSNGFFVRNNSVGKEKVASGAGAAYDVLQKSPLQGNAILVSVYFPTEDELVSSVSKNLDRAKYTSIDESNKTRNSYPMSGSHSGIFFAPNYASAGASYYVSDVSFEFNNSAFQTPQLLYSRKQENADSGGSVFLNDDGRKKYSFLSLVSFFTLISYSLLMSSLVFVTAIVLRTVKRNRNKRKIVGQE